jgi:hypothetical protein
MEWWWLSDYIPRILPILAFVYFLGNIKTPKYLKEKLRFFSIDSATSIHHDQPGSSSSIIASNRATMTSSKNSNSHHPQDNTLPGAASANDDLASFSQSLASTLYEDEYSFSNMAGVPSLREFFLLSETSNRQPSLESEYSSIGGGGLTSLTAMNTVTSIVNNPMNYDLEHGIGRRSQQSLQSKEGATTTSATSGGEMKEIRPSGSSTRE